MPLKKDRTVLERRIFKHTAMTNTFSKKSSRGFSNSKDTCINVPISTPTKRDKRGHIFCRGTREREREREILTWQLLPRSQK
jgi:hypothetical protein